MDKLIQQSVLSHFRSVPDPRVQGRCQYRLIEVIAIVVCARISGAETFEDMEEFALQREAWLREFLDLPHGIPSHDTIARVLSLLEPEALEKAFFHWTQSLVQEMRDRGHAAAGRICLDGKAVNGTQREFRSSSRPLVLVNVFCQELGLTLGQAQATSTGNAEAQAAVECIDALSLQGTLVSADAGLGRKAVLRKIREKKGDYLVPVKGNSRPHLEELLLWSKQQEEAGSPVATVENSRGRMESRKARIWDTRGLSERFFEAYPDAQRVIEIHRTRGEKDQRYVIQEKAANGSTRYRKNEKQGEQKFTEERVLYVSSRKLTASKALEQIRNHWSIENQLHWSLDVVFDEDGCRVREKTTARNLALIRKIAFNLLANAPGKGSKPRKMKRASWNPDYLKQVLLGSGGH